MEAIMASDNAFFKLICLIVVVGFVVVAIVRSFHKDNDLDV